MIWRYCFQVIWIIRKLCDRTVIKNSFSFTKKVWMPSKHCCQSVECNTFFTRQMTLSQTHKVILKVHFIPSDRKVCWILSWSKLFKAFLSYFSSPIKLVPLSDLNCSTWPRQHIKRRVGYCKVYCSTGHTGKQNSISFNNTATSLHINWSKVIHIDLHLKSNAIELSWSFQNRLTWYMSTFTMVILLRFCSHSDRWREGVCGISRSHLMVFCLISVRFNSHISTIGPGQANRPEGWAVRPQSCRVSTVRLVARSVSQKRCPQIIPRIKRHTTCPVQRESGR